MGWWVGTKSCVFKKFEEQNLFQITCSGGFFSLFFFFWFFAFLSFSDAVVESDAVERFKLLLIIGLILLQSEAKDVAYGTVGFFF